MKESNQANDIKMGNQEQKLLYTVVKKWVEESSSHNIRLFL